MKRLISLFIGFSILDVSLTQFALRNGSGELNPIIRSIAGSPWALWTYKLCFTALVVLIAIKVQDRFPSMTRLVMTGLVICTVAICIWNGFWLAIPFLYIPR